VRRAAQLSDSRRAKKKAPREQGSEAGHKGAPGLGGEIKRGLHCQRDPSRIVPASVGRLVEPFRSTGGSRVAPARHRLRPGHGPPTGLGEAPAAFALACRIASLKLSPGPRRL
jgi:hypothetical protein